MSLSVVVLISGAGSNLRALLEATSDPKFPARVVAVGADRQAPGLDHAMEFGIPVFTVPYSTFKTRDEWGEALVEAVSIWTPDLVVFSGLLRLVPPRFVRVFSPNLINTHPAYLPEFPGAHAVRDALAAGATETGASLIMVDESMDGGPVIAQERVPIFPEDTEQVLHDRIKLVERRLLIAAVLEWSARRS